MSEMNAQANRYQANANRRAKQECPNELGKGTFYLKNSAEDK